MTQHGRDQLHTNWPDLYKAEEEATLPAEEVLMLKQGGDYGWPFCYYDSFQQKLVLAPEFGGDGGKKIGVCAQKSAPAAAFPAHWAPNACCTTTASNFRTRYRDGDVHRVPWIVEPRAFSARWLQRRVPADGGWRRPPLLRNFRGRLCRSDEVTEDAVHRPSGLAMGPDGALYVSDDVKGRIYRITYHGSGDGTAGVTPCPSPTEGAGAIVAESAKPPRARIPSAGVAVPEGATRKWWHWAARSITAR